MEEEFIFRYFRAKVQSLSPVAYLPFVLWTDRQFRCGGGTRSYDTVLCHRILTDSDKIDLRNLTCPVESKGDWNKTIQ